MCTCRYDVFWELSLPLAREAPSFPRSVISSGEPKSVKHCLEAFFAGEKLEVGTQPPPLMRNPGCTPRCSQLAQWTDQREACANRHSQAACPLHTVMASSRDECVPSPCERA